MRTKRNQHTPLRVVALVEETLDEPCVLEGLALRPGRQRSVVQAASPTPSLCTSLVEGKEEQHAQANELWDPAVEAAVTADGVDEEERDREDRKE